MMNVKRRRSSDVDNESSNGVIETRRWSDLPSDLLEPIMSNLFFADQINFRAVCKSWHSFNRVVPPLKQMPWLMAFNDREGMHSWDSCKLVDPTYKKTYTIDMSCINKKKNSKDCRVQIHESKYGWLLMSCVSSKTPTSSSSSHSLFLYSPFMIDNNIIELPVLSTASDTCKYIATFDLISPSKIEKKTMGEETDFEVLILSSVMNDRSICFKTCRQGDNSWSCNKTIWNFHLCMINCWVYSEGIFYYTTELKRESESESGSYDIVRNNWTKFPTLVSVSPLQALNMIKFDGEIYLISVNKNGQSWSLMRVCIYKFDLLKGTWESIQLDDLGNRALFVGDGYSSILELDNDVEEFKEHRQNVYYCYTAITSYVNEYYSTMLKYCNALTKNKSRVCSKWYGSVAYGYQTCKRLWIDPPRRIRNSI